MNSSPVTFLSRDSPEKSICRFFWVRSTPIDWASRWKVIDTSNSHRKSSKQRMQYTRSQHLFSSRNSRICYSGPAFSSSRDDRGLVFLSLSSLPPRRLKVCPLQTTIRKVRLNHWVPEKSLEFSLHEIFSCLGFFSLRFSDHMVDLSVVWGLFCDVLVLQVYGGEFVAGCTMALFSVLYTFLISCLLFSVLVYEIWSLVSKHLPPHWFLSFFSKTLLPTNCCYFIYPPFVQFSLYSKFSVNEVVKIELIISGFLFFLVFLPSADEFQDFSLSGKDCPWFFNCSPVVMTVHIFHFFFEILNF